MSKEHLREGYQPKSNTSNPHPMTGHQPTSSPANATPPPNGPAYRPSPNKK